MINDTQDSNTRRNVKVNLTQGDYDRLNVEAVLKNLPLSTLIRNYCITHLDLLEEVRQASEGKVTEGSVLHIQLLGMESRQAMSAKLMEKMLYENRVELRTVLQIIVACAKVLGVPKPSGNNESLLPDMYQDIINTKLIEGAL